MPAFRSIRNCQTTHRGTLYPPILTNIRITHLQRYQPHLTPGHTSGQTTDICQWQKRHWFIGFSQLMSLMGGVHQHWFDSIDWKHPSGVGRFASKELIRFIHLMKHFFWGRAVQRTDNKKNILWGEAGHQTDYTIVAIGPGHWLIYWFDGAHR